MKNNKPQLHISLSLEHKKYQSDISDSFKAFDVTFDGGLMRLSESELPMQLIIFLGGWIVSNVAWDLFKLGIKQVYKKFTKAGITLYDDKSVMYSVRPDLTVRAIVTPDRTKEFENIKTIDDLVTHLQNMAKNNTPVGWSLLPTGDIFTFIKSYAFSRENLTNDTLNNEGIGNIHYGDIHSTFSTPSINLKKISVPMIKDRSFTPKPEDFLVDGDLIMADASEDYEGVGVTVSLHGLEGKKIVGGLHTFVLRDTKNKTNQYFRQYIFRNPVIRNSLQKVANGVSVYGISKTAVSKLLLPIPPIPEQNRIVAVLETWDKTIEKLARKIEVKKSVKKGLMQKLLTGKVRVKGFNEPWVTKKMGSLFTERNESKYNDLPLLSITADKGVIYQTDSNKKDTSNQDKSKYKRICPGDIGYNTMRMWQGRCALSSIEGIVSPAYTIVTPKKDTNPTYFAYLFKTLRLAYLFFQTSQGLVSDTWNCKFKDFSIVKYQVPNYEEQTAIANILTTADKEIETLEKKLALFEEQKKFLLNNLITGKIRVPEQ